VTTTRRRSTFAPDDPADPDREFPLWNATVLGIVVDKMAHFLVDCGGVRSLVRMLHNFWSVGGPSYERSSFAGGGDGSSENLTTTMGHQSTASNATTATFLTGTGTVGSVLVAEGGAAAAAAVSSASASVATTTKMSSVGYSSIGSGSRRGGIGSSSQRPLRPASRHFEEAASELFTDVNLEKFRLVAKIVDTVVDFVCPSAQRFKLLSALYAGVEWIFRNVCGA
jgi:hypothetical protein